MEIKVDKEARDTRIFETADTVIRSIKQNAEAGIDTTLVNIPRDIYSEVSAYLKNRVSNITRYRGDVLSNELEVKVFITIT